jgi:formamidopyrimidine-DNA glycosylase
LEKIADDIMDTKTNWTVFYNNIESKMNKIKNKAIEEIITDQQLIISGIGNYLKSEILYDCKLAPNRKIKNINEEELKSLFNSMKTLTKKLTKSLDIDEDKEGYYEKQFKVYRKEEDPLGNKVETYKTKSGRTTHWVPSIQK